MKKFYLLTVALIMCLSGCGDTDSDSQNSQTNVTTPTVSSSITTTTTTVTTTCNHIWIEASCTEPKTCSVCGETSGEPTGHQWEEATCTTPKICSVCGKTEGSTKKHKWKDATCTEPKTCSVCGKTDGSAKGHKWKEATYDSPKTCKTCGKTEGDPLERVIPNIYLNTQLPCQINHYGSLTNKLMTTSTITGVDISIEENYNKSFDIIFKFSGQRDYDYQGELHSTAAVVGIKIYDSNGNVVDSDTYYSPNICYGETFANDEKKMYYVKLDPSETYYVELLNVK